MPTLFTLLSDIKPRQSVLRRDRVSPPPALSGIRADYRSSLPSSARKAQPEGATRPDVLVGTVLGSISGLVVSALPGLADGGAYAWAGPLAPFLLLGAGVGLMAGAICAWFRS